MLKKGGEGREFLFLFPFPPLPLLPQSSIFAAAGSSSLYSSVRRISPVCSRHIWFQSRGRLGRAGTCPATPLFPHTSRANYHEPQSERKLVPAHPFRTTAPVRYLTVALRLLLLLSGPRRSLWMEFRASDVNDVGLCPSSFLSLPSPCF